MTQSAEWSEERALFAKGGASIQPGLTPEEIARAESIHDFVFPDDLRSLLQTFLPRGGAFPDWRDPESPSLAERMRGPENGIVFDVERNGFWWDTWPARPNDCERAKLTARKEIRQAPVLIPIYGHRFLPSRPVSAGNPVFSIHQTDIVYYGRDLSSYLGVEFGAVDWAAGVEGELKTIEFWTALADT